MKKTIIALTALAVSGSALATNPTITFNGQVTSQTCTASINGVSNATITLQNIAATSLSTANSVGGTTSFTINVTGCTSPQIGIQLIPINGNVDSDGNLLNLAASSPATKVALQLLDNNSAAINLGTTYKTLHTGLTGPVNENFPLYVQYISVPGGATAGYVQGVVEYAIAYQ